MDRSQGSVLIVEDDAALRHGPRTSLDALGFDVGEAGNGEDGLVRLRMIMRR
jgi:two-component system, OmpR family, KDP operon response regulator KdpE